MEPRRERPKDPRPHPQVKPKRFRIVKLEERIAPKHSGCVSSCGGGGTYPTMAC
jgi:hypothetical protein